MTDSVFNALEAALQADAPDQRRMIEVLMRMGTKRPDAADAAIVLDGDDDREASHRLPGGFEGLEQVAVLVASFASGWAEHTSVLGPDGLADDELAKIGREAGARAAVAAAWRRRVGDTLETTAVTDLLAISRQALDSRKRTGSVLALPGAGTSHYPTWQFDVEGGRASVRPITSQIVTAFRAAADDVSPYTIAAWATSPQPELGDCTPANWIAGGGDALPVVLAAQRAAHLEVV